VDWEGGMGTGGGEGRVGESIHGSCMAKDSAPQVGTSSTSYLASCWYQIGPTFVPIEPGSGPLTDTPVMKATSADHEFQVYILMIAGAGPSASASTRVAGW
jgi:hypothetical protein